MKKNILKTLGIMVLNAGLVATTAAGCGGCGTKETTDVPATEVVEAVVETEAIEETEATPETTEEVVAESTEVVAETEVVEEPEFTVTDMSATKYAKQSVNVRKGPSADDEKLGGLSTNQKVTVTGQADNGWYRIEYNGAEGYVSGKYLADQKVAVNTNSGNSSNASASGNSNTGTTATTQPANNAASANTDNSGWTDTPSSAPAVDNTVNTPGVDNSANASAGTVTTEPDYSQMSPEELAAATGATLGQTGGSAGTGVGGEWIE